VTSTSSIVPSMLPADQTSIRRINLSLVLRTIARTGLWSRARISSETTLNKATVSSLVGELIERRLIREGEVERGGLGRPGQLLEIDPNHVACVGVEISVDYLAGFVLDLTGAVISGRRIYHGVRAPAPDEILNRAAALIRELISAAGPRVIPSIRLGIPGMVDFATGTLVYAPNLRWNDVDVATSLAALLDIDRGRISVDNEGNAAALAEYTTGSAAGTPDLVLVTGAVGVGGGVIAGGELLRGSLGYFGEFGHMSLAGDDVLCGCGRTGCWEATVGLEAILDRTCAPDDPLREVDDLPSRLAELSARAVAGDRRTVRGLEESGRLLGRGASALVNVFNPAVMMFGGTFAALADHLVAPLTEELRARIVAPSSAGCRVEFSRLAFDAAGLGAAHLGIEAIFADPASVTPGNTFARTAGSS